MLTVKDLLKTKGPEVWSVTPDSSTLQALRLMAEKNVGALLVLEGEKIAGIISERDFARWIAEKGKCESDIPVNQFMTEELYVVSPSQTIHECMQLMTARHFRHLPVLENGKLVGLISIGDVVKGLIADQESKIENLENYIYGVGYGH